MSLTDEIRQRFDAAVSFLPKIRIMRDDPEPPDPEADLAFNIGPWARSPECADLFLPWIEERIEQLDREEAEAVRSHPDLLLTKGMRMEAKAIRDQFHKWRGTSRKAPGAKE